MSVIEIITSVVLLIAAIGLIIMVLSQQGKDAYLGGAVAGGAAESFLGKNKASSLDKTLTKITRVLAIVVVALVLVVNVLTVLMNK